MLGWIVPAAGAWRSGVLGPVRCLALALTALLPLGVLKGTTPLSIVAAAGLCAALAPLGLRILLDGPRPGRAAVARFTATATLVIALGFAASLG